MASPPGLLPPPPKPFRLLLHKAGVWYRVHAGKYAPAAFNASGLGNARFSPLFDPATNKPIPMIYAASDERGAIAEVVLHDVPTPSAGYLHDLEADYSNDLHLSRIGTAPLQLVNLTSLGLKASGLVPSDLFDGEKDDYPRTRAWALWIWQNMPRAQGLHWMSKRDNRCEVIVLFGDRIHSTEIWDDKSSQSLQAHEDLVIDLLAQMGAGVYPAI
ncbi:RES family NAD+ phosphorylase [Variovorax sp. DT-64]|uniref:RES family NAD+ phosphorylase n=1 Tax=Variovorax sp. DT-64 TaxID=3396160 RepID=UPI003F1D817D